MATSLPSRGASRHPGIPLHFPETGVENFAPGCQAAAAVSWSSLAELLDRRPRPAAGLVLLPVAAAAIALTWAIAESWVAMLFVGGVLGYLLTTLLAIVAPAETESGWRPPRGLRTLLQLAASLAVLFTGHELAEVLGIPAKAGYHTPAWLYGSSLWVAMSGWITRVLR
jgi:hypothetical protein